MHPHEVFVVFLKDKKKTLLRGREWLPEVLELTRIKQHITHDSAASHSASRLKGSSKKRPRWIFLVCHLQKSQRWYCWCFRTAELEPVEAWGIVFSTFLLMLYINLDALEIWGDVYTFSLQPVVGCRIFPSLLEWKDFQISQVPSRMLLNEGILQKLWDASQSIPANHLQLESECLRLSIPYHLL